MLVNSQLHRGNSCIQTHTLELIKLTQAYFTPDPEKSAQLQRCYRSRIPPRTVGELAALRSFNRVHLTEDWSGKFLGNSSLGALSCNLES